VTPWNRVVKIDLSSGLAAEIVPRTPVVSGYGYGGNGLVPGSMGVIWGTALSDGSASATEPLPLSLREVSVKVGNLDAPMISIEPAAVRYQIPFEATPTLGPTPITIASKSPFEQDPRLSPQNTNITAWDLSFLDLSPDPAIYSGISAIHEDFGSLVTLDNPAEAGEIVHFYAVGLGPVSPAVATGQPSPWNPPARAVDPLLCSMDESVNGASVPVEVLFAGLAPGMSGIYQVSVQLPSSFNLKSGQRYVVVRCSTAGATSDGAVLVDVHNSQRTWPPNDFSGGQSRNTRTQGV